MGFWKVLGGAVLGVAAVAAAPFTGGGSVLGAATLVTSLSGAGTIAAATGAATVGALGGEILSEEEEEEKELAKEEGITKTQAKYERELEILYENLQNAITRLKDDKSFFQLIIALFAIGMATANADGYITEEEMKELDEFVLGIAKTELPDHIKDIITNLRNNPPSFNTAMEYVKKLGDNIDIRLFESVIKLIAISDGYFSRDEQALLEAFDRAVVNL